MAKKQKKAGESKFKLTEGKLMLQAVRRAIELYLEEKRIHEIEHKHNWFDKKAGIFVTLHTHPEKSLRGCIGFVEPAFSLRDALPKAALSAAFNDPRFEPVTKEELEKITAELSILSKSEMIKAKNPAQLLEKITPRIDGLILKKNGATGLFLPQVWGIIPDKEQFLANLCLKAGLSNTNAWKDTDAKLFKFKVQAFEEVEPAGAVVERD